MCIDPITKKKTNSSIVIFVFVGIISLQLLRRCKESKFKLAYIDIGCTHRSDRGIKKIFRIYSELNIHEK